MVDPVVMALVAGVLIIAGWNYIQLRALEDRLTKLEKEYLALIEELETRIYSP